MYKESEETIKICKQTIEYRKNVLQGIRENLQKLEEMKIDFGEDSDEDCLSCQSPKKAYDIFM